MVHQRLRGTVYRPSNGTLQTLATATRQTRILIQLPWLPKRPFPRVNSQDLLRAAMEHLKTLLKNPTTETLVGNLEQTQFDELIHMMNIFLADTRTFLAASLEGWSLCGPSPKYTRHQLSQLQQGFLNQQRHWALGQIERIDPVL
jgi:hypothetical protein